MGAGAQELDLPQVEVIPGRVLSVAFSGDGFPECEEHVKHVEGDSESGAVRNELLDDDKAFP